MEEVPLLKSVQAKYAKDVVIIGVSIDANLTRTDKTIKEKGMTWPVLADGQAFDGPNPKRYRIMGTPELYVLDRTGRIAARFFSAKQLEANLQPVLAAAQP